MTGAEELKTQEFKDIIEWLSKMESQLIELKSTFLKIIPISEGWVSIERKSNYIDFMFTSHKDYHNLRSSTPCQIITISKEGNISCLKAYYRTALSLWLVWGLGKSKDEDLKKAIHFTKWVYLKLRDQNGK